MLVLKVETGKCVSPFHSSELSLDWKIWWYESARTNKVVWSLAHLSTLSLKARHLRPRINIAIKRSNQELILPPSSHIGMDAFTFNIEATFLKKIVRNGAVVLPILVLAPKFSLGLHQGSNAQQAHVLNMTQLMRSTYVRKHRRHYDRKSISSPASHFLEGSQHLLFNLARPFFNNRHASITVWSVNSMADGLLTNQRRIKWQGFVP